MQKDTLEDSTNKLAEFLGKLIGKTALSLLSGWIMMVIVNYFCEKYGVDFSIGYWDSVLVIIFRNALLRVRVVKED